MSYIKKTSILLAVIAGIIIFYHGLSPQIASAHEVYVLSPAQITDATHMAPFDMLDTVRDNLSQFTFWAFISILVIIGVFFISIMRVLERWLDPFFSRIRPYAPFVARITVGLSFLAAAYYQASYGPELPLINTYGSYTGFVTAILVIIGIMIIVGLYARIAAGVALVMYAVAVWFHGWYMLTYLNYLGEIIVLFLLGSHNISLDNMLTKNTSRPSHQKNIDEKNKKGGLLSSCKAWLAPRSFAILRICFGISLISASAYAKVIYNNLALFTVVKYHLDVLLGFEPHFLVLGAAIIEILLGTFIILGFEIRFTALFFEFWLVQSLCFFGEAVWPHIILIGIPIALFMYGYDNYSVEGYLMRKKKYEPIL